MLLRIKTEKILNYVWDSKINILHFKITEPRVLKDILPISEISHKIKLALWKSNLQWNFRNKSLHKPSFFPLLKTFPLTFINVLSLLGF